ncbi:Protein-disulfide isomerase [Mesorhizobium albiziae]|uniref:Protein-disulfide isomerase n=1 Tax=Neomesorhizobium albiziae TaxID=335020 RepID=A0A1I4EXH2_9HYPH|nr:DsbA family protein [Mesorhizobium albiziae]GLS30694.1 DSBA oxidoreductase [Mesorhizobium albiziae]SFL10425.1 Protein-disulfide isomerase [Mesorhizobium albiziae]
MKKSILLGTAGAVAILAVGLFAGRPAPALAQETPMDRKQVETIVRDYLLANPELLLEVQEALEAKQKEAQRLASLGVIKEAKAEIFNSEFDGVVGNPDGKVTIVEFYDYNCGYCKRAIEDMHALIKADPDLRFVLKEFPILGPDSQKAHTVSMAFRKMMPEKYREFHDQLLGGQGRAGEASAIKIALALGADEKKLREEMQDPAIAEAFASTYELANKLAITGTPSYVVGNEVVFGALGQEVLAEKISAAKNCGEATC